MILPDLVLVHGGAHAADCWDFTIAELGRQAPDLRVLAVDLPGRGSKPADLSRVTAADWVDSVVADIEDAGLGDVVIVGHSLAGVTVPGVVARLGSTRVREMIMAAAFIPPQGSGVLDTLRGPLGSFSRWRAKEVTSGTPGTLPAAIARLAFCNGMNRDQRRFALSCIYPECTTVLTQPVDRTDLPDDVARTWILTLRDRALSTRQQRNCIKALGGVDTVIGVNTCHDVMISRPRQLAHILVERCRLAANR